jgi:hypothetical protein
MTEPLHYLGNALRPRPVGQFRPLDHDDRQAKFARSIDLGSCGCSAGVAGDDPFDPAGAHHFQLALKREWSARHDDVGIRERQRPIRRIDKPQSVGVLRFGAEGGDVLPADCEKHASALEGQRHRSGSDIRHIDPIVAGRPGPWRTLKRDQPCSGESTRQNRVAAHLGCEGMGCIDDMRDCFATNVFGKTVRSAETAGTRRQLLPGRGARASTVGIGRVKPGPRDSIRKQMSIARSAQDEGAYHA